MDELYVLAREVLLDALDALRDHQTSIILVGAQAIYLHVGDADLSVAPYTTDGDLALDPHQLRRTPALEEALSKAGFRPKASDSVGVWLTQRQTLSHPRLEVAVDLLVLTAVSPGKGRRAAHLEGHSQTVARKVSGLEGALVDKGEKQISSFMQGSTRSCSLSVAGPAALLIAKAFKIQDRSDSSRANDKDALDVFRLLRGVSTEELTSRFRNIFADARSEATARAGIGFLEQLFGSSLSLGSRMAARSLHGIVEQGEVAMSCEFLVQDLLEELRKDG